MCVYFLNKPLKVTLKPTQSHHSRVFLRSHIFIRKITNHEIYKHDQTLHCIPCRVPSVTFP